MTTKEAIELIPHVAYAYNTKNFVRGSFTATEWFKTVRKALEQESVIEDIKAEFINLYPRNYAGELELGGIECVFSLNKVLSVIDKHISGGDNE